MDWIEYGTTGNDYVPVEDWGKDHWSTFAYLETRPVDDAGKIDNRRMRCNSRLHRPFANRQSLMTHREYPTILKCGTIDNHDDWSCLEDMVAAGLLRAWFRVIKHGEAFGNSEAKIELTEKGWRLANQLRMHKANGGTFANFCPELP